MKRMRIGILAALFLSFLIVSSGGVSVRGQTFRNTYLPLIANSTGPARMVADLTPGAQGSQFYMRSATARGDTLFFVLGCADLWKSAGTESTTTLIRSFTTTGLSFCPYVGNLILFDNTLFFTVHNAQGVTSLWSSDGSPSGTRKVADISSVLHTSRSSIHGLIDLDRALYFFANGFDPNGTNETTELWRSDGSAAGTTRILSFVGATAYQPVVFAGKIYFSVDDQAKTTLWVSDGTAQGTRLVADTGPIYDLTPSTRALWFAAGGSQGYGLWTSDGTKNGTRSVKTFSYDLAPTQFVELHDQIFFSLIYTMGTSTYELWKTDGTTARTMQIFDGNVADLTVQGQVLYFISGNGQLYRSDGTSKGTVKISSSAIAFGEPFSAEQWLYFSGYTAASGDELWVSDGTTAGTHQVQDINPGPGSSSPHWLGRAGNTLYFIANDGKQGTELWAMPIGG